MERDRLPLWELVASFVEAMKARGIAEFVSRKAVCSDDFADELAERMMPARAPTQLQAQAVMRHLAEHFCSAIYSPTSQQAHADAATLREAWGRAFRRRKQMRWRQHRVEGESCLSLASAAAGAAAADDPETATAGGLGPYAPDVADDAAPADQAAAADEAGDDPGNGTDSSSEVSSTSCSTTSSDASELMDGTDDEEKTASASMRTPAPPAPAVAAAMAEAVASAPKAAPVQPTTQRRATYKRPAASSATQPAAAAPQGRPTTALAKRNKRREFIAARLRGSSWEPTLTGAKRFKTTQPREGLG